MSGEKIDILDMGRILFGMLGGINTQNGRIVRGLIQRIEQLENENKILKEKENDKTRSDRFDGKQQESSGME